jgi:Carboxypeptidase regulatory-like domain
MGRLLLLVCSILPVWSGSISGVVVDSAGAVIANAKATLVGENGHRAEARSDQMGRFVFADLKPGAYSVEIYSAGFRDRKIASLQVRGEEETRVPAIELSVVTQACDFPPVDTYTPITPGGSQLSGRTFLASNTRATAALVTLYDPKSHREVRKKLTDTAGNFLFNGLHPGIYELRVRRVGFAELFVEKVEIRSGFKSGAENFILTPCPGGAPCPAVKWTSMSLCL